MGIILFNFILFKIVNVSSRRKFVLFYSKIRRGRFHRRGIDSITTPLDLMGSSVGAKLLALLIHDLRNPFS